MFHWDKSIRAINIPVSKVVQLFRSMRDVQLALPGVSAQLASAYLCQYQQEGGVATIVVFHLHKSRILAFYCSDTRVVPARKIESMLDQGLNFVESMGFLMTDQDIHLLDRSDQEMLWSSLPLTAGLQDAAPLAADQAAPAKKTKEQVKAGGDQPGGAHAPQNMSTISAAVVSGEASLAEPEAAPEPDTAEPAPAVETEENVDELLAAVEAMRNRRPGVRARKSPPSEQEMAQRRSQLCQTVGRILVSL